MQAALPFFIADGAQSQGQQFLRLQYGINIAGITLRITKGSIQQRFGNAGRLYAQPACAGQADRPGCRFPRCLWPPRQFQTVRKSPPFPLSPSSQIPPQGCGRYSHDTDLLILLQHNLEVYVIYFGNKGIQQRPFTLYLFLSNSNALSIGTQSAYRSGQRNSLQ